MARAQRTIFRAVSPTDTNVWYEFIVYRDEFGLTGISEVSNNSGYLAPIDIMPDWLIDAFVQKISEIEAVPLGETSESPWTTDYELEYDGSEVDASPVSTGLEYSSQREYLLARVEFASGTTVYDPIQVGVRDLSGAASVFYQETGTAIEDAAETLAIPSGMQVLSEDEGALSELFSTASRTQRLALRINGEFMFQRIANSQNGVLLILSRRKS